MKFIPQPKSVELTGNNTLKITSISLGDNLLSRNAVNDFLSFLSLPQKEKNVFFAMDDTLDEEEYILSVNENGIHIHASSQAGQLYALQTLKQMIFQSDGDIPFVLIKDKPKYKFRGFMLDVGRYFFSVDDVKKIINRMVIHKLNVLHFHLTEDQGWRIEIKKISASYSIWFNQKENEF